MSPRRIGLGELLDHFRSGRSVYLPGATGELAFLREALAAEPDRLDGVELTSCLIPGMNGFDYAALHPAARLTTFLLPPPLRPSFEAGRVRVVPLAYSGIAAYLANAAPDVAILNVAPPQNGQCSFGVCADFGPIVAAKAKLRIGVINAGMPRPKRSPAWALDDFDAVIEIEERPPPAAEAEPGPELKAIGAHVARLVPDGAAVQTGIGQAPTAVWAALCGHRGLRLRSGMAASGFVQALEAGALAPDGHLAGVAYGDARLYELLDGSDHVAFADTRTTHWAGLAGVEGLVAVNSALEVDLFGQANLEWMGGRLMSGVGGAPDFCRAARASAGGRAIVALPATAKRGTISRIVPRLEAPTVSLGKDLADTVVTEHGVAEIGGLSLDARAERLIAVAAPEHRDALAEGWRALRASL